MKKRIVDLTPQELDNAASSAWKAATQQSIARGIPVTGSRDGRRFRYHPDGHVEDLGPIMSLDDEDIESNRKDNPGRRSVA